MPSNLRGGIWASEILSPRSGGYTPIRTLAVAGVVLSVNAIADFKVLGLWSTCCKVVVVQL